MTSTYEKTRFITRTALCTALVLLAQLAGKFFLPAGLPIYGPFTVNQLVTGSLVNLVLILSAASIGLWAGVACGVVSSILATLMGMTPIPFITPAIALGNVVIAAAAWYFFAKVSSSKLRVVGVVVGAAAKCAFLWVTVPLILGLIPNIPQKQIAMLSIMFSWPQFITALIGGILALVAYAPLKRALGERIN